LGRGLGREEGRRGGGKRRGGCAGQESEAPGKEGVEEVGLRGGEVQRGVGGLRGDGSGWVAGERWWVG